MREVGERESGKQKKKKIKKINESERERERERLFSIKQSQFSFDLFFDATKHQKIRKTIFI